MKYTTEKVSQTPVREFDPGDAALAARDPEEFAIRRMVGSFAEEIVDRLLQHKKEGKTGWDDPDYWLDKDDPHASSCETVICSRIRAGLGHKPATDLGALCALLWNAEGE